jgi:hypothetical protein
MYKINQWTLTICAVSIISGILLYIIPKSNQKNLFKVIVSTILVYSVIHPLIGSKGIDFRIDDFLSDNYQVSENLDNYALNSMLSSAEKAIEELLEAEATENKISCNFKCECIIENNEIAIKKILVKSFLTDSEKDLIIDIITEFAFDESVVTFEGE